MPVCNVFQLLITLTTSWSQNWMNFNESKMDSQETVDQRMEMNRFNHNASYATSNASNHTHHLQNVMRNIKSSFSRPKHTSWAYYAQTWLFISISFESIVAEQKHRLWWNCRATLKNTRSDELKMQKFLCKKILLFFISVCTKRWYMSSEWWIWSRFLFKKQCAYVRNFWNAFNEEH